MHKVPLKCVVVYLCFIDRDVMEVAREIVATISDPQGMVGPEVCKSIALSCSKAVYSWLESPHMIAEPGYKLNSK